MSATPDIGYSPSSLTWTYESEGRVLRTSTFEEQHTLIGDRFIDLLNSAKRTSGHGSGNTIMHKVAALRRIASAIAKYSDPEATTAEWLSAYVTYLREDEDSSDTTRWAHYNHGSAVIRELARREGIELRAHNPFTRRRVRKIVLADNSDVANILRQAKADVFAYVSRFRTPPAEHVPFIDKTRALWVLGTPFYVVKNPEVRRLTDSWREATGLTFDYLKSYIYPSRTDIAPLLILISNALAANPDSVSLMTRDSMIPFIHPAYGQCYKLQLDKPRAGSISPYLVRNNGTLSLGWLIEAVLELTTPLIPFASERNKNLVFLAMGLTQRVQPIHSSRRSEALYQYLKSRQLPAITLRDLRRHRGISEYNRTGDIFRVKKLLNQAHIATTMLYLDEHLTQNMDGRIIANAQSDMLEPRPGSAEISSPLTEHARTVSGHSCSNPYDAAKPSDANGLCLSYLWPFNDRHFILDFSPRTIAYLLRDYDSLCEAQLRIPTARFTRLYLPWKQKIETDVLPFIDEALRQAAQAIIPSLTPAPRMD